MASHCRTLLYLCALWLPSSGLMAEREPGLSFVHKDWQLVCDNTHTCRAAGYQSDEEKWPISVLLTRKAGPGEHVTAKVQVADWEDNIVVPDIKLPDRFMITLHINGRPIGSVVMDSETRTADLPQVQVDALLPALLRTSTIEWAAGGVRWRLSDKGAAAVLLKMDDFQGRLNTPGALVRKGTQSEDKVVKPLPPPVVVIPHLPDSHDDDIRLDPAASEGLRAALVSTATEDCSLITSENPDERPIYVYRLSETKLLASAPCWIAAQSRGDGYWVVNAKPPYDPVLVTESGATYGSGVIHVYIGSAWDRCHFSEDWSWNGARFIQTNSSSTGLCKSISLGGAWELPTLIMDVRHAR